MSVLIEWLYLYKIMRKWPRWYKIMPSDHNKWKRSSIIYTQSAIFRHHFFVSQIWFVCLFKDWNTVIILSHSSIETLNSRFVKSTTTSGPVRYCYILRLFIARFPVDDSSFQRYYAFIFGGSCPEVHPI